MRVQCTLKVGSNLYLISMKTKKSLKTNSCKNSCGSDEK